MQQHPGGTEHTSRLLSLAGLCPPCRVLDLGAGDGDAVRYLRALGFDALGLDLAPGADVERGDILRAPFSDGEFDAIISQCTFFVSGDVGGAYREAHRLLRRGGTLLVSDVCFPDPPEAPMGFRRIFLEDETPAWREYYIECVWNGTAEALCECIPQKACRYYLAGYIKEA